MRTARLIIAWVVVALLTIWALAALYIDCRIPALRIPLTLAYLAAVIVVLLKVKRLLLAVGLCIAGFCVVLIWWLSLKPSNVGDWQEDASRTAWVEFNGDQATIHNLRDCDYRTEMDYTNCWSDRTVRLSQLQGADFFFTNWGSPLIAHPIVSFHFADGQHVAYSIEARYKVGQAYSAILGFFRQYELVVIAADERDVIRLRTNYRKGEEVSMYRTTLTPEEARAIFMLYANYQNQLKDHPEWYNALTRNCTTTMDKQIAASLRNPHPWDYRLLFNGKLDELLYERGRLASDGLSFSELKERVHINPVARTVDKSPDFSSLIRVGRPGF